MRIVGSKVLPCGHQRVAKLDTSNHVRRCRTCGRKYTFAFVPAEYIAQRCSMPDAVRVQFEEVAS